ncbi:hypothetical protein MRB53_011229 [Persea americana]|uniref:Uncharacterized protein n=1 Tax=Persea americana TaxID=3435 RepID=A0ACC2LUZ0_PERAE|nr:hypothetical protein MRB53_011229 [Persea americana]
MRIRSCPNSEISVLVILLLLCSTFLCIVPGTLSSVLVTLESIQIFSKHEPIIGEPSVYFRCQGENKTMLPDVKKTNFLYTFRGAESWQPLTKLPGNKCKRCGLYEEDHLTPDDVFDEWELCPDDFTAPSGKYIRFKDNEFNATLLCPQCPTSDSARSSRSKDGSDGKGMNVLLVILISVLVSGVALIGAVAGYRYWQKKKRDQDQARFLKLFEEGDDVEDELD